METEDWMETGWRLETGGQAEDEDEDSFAMGGGGGARWVLLVLRVVAHSTGHHSRHSSHSKANPSVLETQDYGGFELSLATAAVAGAGP